MATSNVKTSTAANDAKKALEEAKKRAAEAAKRAAEAAKKAAEDAARRAAAEAKKRSGAETKYATGQEQFFKRGEKNRPSTRFEPAKAATSSKAAAAMPPVVFRTPARSEPGSSLSSAEMVKLADKFPTWSSLMREIAVARGEARSVGGQVHPALKDLTKEQVVLLDRFTQGAIGSRNLGRVGAAISAPVMATVGAAGLASYEVLKKNPTFSALMARIMKDDQYKVDDTTSDGRALNAAAVVAGWNHGIVSKKPVD